MNIIQNINYNKDNSQWQLGDLYVPAGPGPFPIALCIHGGGWSAMDRYSFAGVAEYMCSQGFAAFNIEYRLLGVAPWPACGDDCIAAAKFLLDGGIKDIDLKTDKLFIVGASAGGHLALMTGMRLPAEKVSGIVSISGVTSLELCFRKPGFRIDYKTFWGYDPSPDEIKDASPIDLITTSQPPVLCTHCPVDSVVGIEHAESFVNKCIDLGVRAELFKYSRPQDGHCIWIPGSNPHKLFPEIENAIINFAHKFH